MEGQRQYESKKLNWKARISLGLTLLVFCGGCVLPKLVNSTEGNVTKTPTATLPCGTNRLTYSCSKEHDSPAVLIVSGPDVTDNNMSCLPGETPNFICFEVGVACTTPTWSASATVTP